MQRHTIRANRGSELEAKSWFTEAPFTYAL